MTSLMFRPPSRHLLRRLYLSSNPLSLSTASNPSSPQTQKLNRIADELLSLTKLEKYDYSVLFTHKMGLHRYIRNVSALNAAAGGGVGSGGATPAAAEAKAEKTAFDVKLEKFDAGVKIKIIKEVRSFTDLGLKEAKDLVEKAPVVVKRGLTKEEAEAIVEKLKGLGATVVLE